MTPEPKQMVDLSVYVQEALRVSIGTKPAHLPFLLSGGFMGDLHRVVCILLVAVRD